MATRTIVIVDMASIVEDEQNAYLQDAIEEAREELTLPDCFWAPNCGLHRGVQ